MIYLDHAATTPVLPSVVDVITNTMQTVYGNPSSPHNLGRQARDIIETVRKQIADSINAEPEEIIFTSGATESNNLAIKGYVNNYYTEQVIYSPAEHPSVRNIETLNNVAPTKLKNGHVDLEDLEKRLKQSPHTLLSVIHVNNETGFIQDIGAIGKLCSEYWSVFHVDATQSYMKVPIDVKKQHIDMLSVTGHKLGCPKGIGFLYKRKELELEPLFNGGHQEENQRAGTENVPYIAGLGEAIRWWSTYGNYKEQMKKLKMSLVDQLIDDGFILNGRFTDDYLPSIVSIQVQGCRADNIVGLLNEKNIYISAGSACSSGNKTPSLSLLGQGLTEEEAVSTIRISFGHQNTQEDINTLVKELKQAAVFAAEGKGNAG